MDNTSVGKDITLYIMRHGLSWGNIEETPSFDYEKENPPLTPLGKTQAEKAATRFERGSLDRIYSSPLIRAIETAYPTAEKLSIPIVIVPALVEKSTRCIGVTKENASGFPLVRFDDTLPPAATDRPFDHEEPENAQARAARVLDLIISTARDGDRILLVSHGTFYSYLMRHLTGLTLPASFRWKFDNSAITTFRFYRDDLPKLCYVNDVRHLPAEEIT